MTCLRTAAQWRPSTGPKTPRSGPHTADSSATPRRAPSAAQEAWTARTPVIYAGSTGRRSGERGRSDDLRPLRPLRPPDDSGRGGDPRHAWRVRHRPHDLPPQGPLPRAAPADVLAPRLLNSRSCPGPALASVRAAANRLLAFFVMHKTLDASELEAFISLAAVWVAVARALLVDQQQLDKEYERYRIGEL
ncbi:DUF6300 family protein (plasmid) [Streptomyces sp. NBC_01717]